jgi:hypothetical protein
MCSVTRIAGGPMKADESEKKLIVAHREAIYSFRSMSLYMGIVTSLCLVGKQSYQSTVATGRCKEDHMHRVGAN